MSQFYHFESVFSILEYKKMDRIGEKWLSKKSTYILCGCVNQAEEIIFERFDTPFSMARQIYDTLNSSSVRYKINHYKIEEWRFYIRRCIESICWYLKSNGCWTVFYFCCKKKRVMADIPGARTKFGQGLYTVSTPSNRAKFRDAIFRGIEKEILLQDKLNEINIAQEEEMNQSEIISDPKEEEEDI